MILEKTDIETLTHIINKFQLKYNIGKEELFGILEGKEAIPVSVFNRRLSPLETVSKYLHENRGMTITQISGALGKQPSSTWVAIRNAKKKCKSKLVAKRGCIHIPLEYLKSDKLSLLELVVVFLRDTRGLKFRGIGAMLKRNERTIWTAYHRGKNK
jgi:DNA-directed RNA polymerase specialized sigma24 family protein